jgi:hypothetical protein
VGKVKRSLEQIIDASSAYPGDVSSYYRETVKSLLGEPDEVMNGIAALTKLAIETGCTAQEAADAIAALFLADLSEAHKKKVKPDAK